MSDKELAPISVEVVAIEDLDSIKVIANANTSKENNAGIGERADAFLGLASNVIDLVEGKQLYKVEVPEGYSLKDLVVSKKDSEAVRALVRDPKGCLSGDVSLKAARVSPAQIASVGLAAAAMVVGQAYMTEISDSLQRIDAKLESIASMIASDQKAKVKNALDIAKTYAALHDDYLQKPAEARQAARNEIEGRYNDVGQVIDWITEQLASVEEQRILDKSQGFLKKRQVLAALMEMKIGGMKGVFIALPRGTQGNALKRLVSQTPRAAAKEQVLEAKVKMRASLRSGESKLRSEAEDRKGEIERIAAASRSARTLLTDGTDCWLIDDQTD